MAIERMSTKTFERLVDEIYARERNRYSVARSDIARVARATILRCQIEIYESPAEFNPYTVDEALKRLRPGTQLKKRNEEQTLVTIMLLVLEGEQGWKVTLGEHDPFFSPDELLQQFTHADLSPIGTAKP
jgi:hypothetical protein